MSLDLLGDPRREYDRRKYGYKARTGQGWRPTHRKEGRRRGRGDGPERAHTCNPTKRRCKPMLNLPQPPVEYSPLPDDAVMARLAGNHHQLVWYRASGDVYLDEQRTLMGFHLPSEKFQVQAETFFCVHHTAVTR